MKTKPQSAKAIQTFQRLVFLAESCKELSFKREILKAQSKLLKKVK